jgi:uncharacterized cysteine cluster protein YcgN (CxxCxxCC family)
MKKYEIIPTTALTDVLCDICGTSCKTQLNDFEYAELSATWGYCSSKDGESHTTLMCENCFDRVVEHIRYMKQTREEPKND